MNKKILAIPALMLVATLGISATASAESINGNVTVMTHPTPNTPINGKVEVDMKMRGDGMNHNAIFGTVTAINGNTITVSSKSMDKKAATQVTTTYMVNASAAVVDKNTAASTVSAIAVGDNIMVEGKIDGVNVTATKIHNGVMAKGGMPSATPMPEGNGQPIVGGTVTAVSGNTVTITNKSNVSYTIDATNAKITRAGTTAAISNIAVGDSLVAQGTINGTSVTAATIMDSGTVAAAAQPKVGIFGQIGNFFARIFGFGK